MVQKFRHIVHLIIAFFSDYLSLLGRPLFYQLQYQHFRNEIGNNIQKKKLCILGNGPSFSQINDSFEKLANYDFCAVNLSVTSEIFFHIKPKMYVVVDMSFWMHKEHEQMKKAWDCISKINWNIEIFIPYNFPNYVKKTLEKNPYVRIYRYSNNPWEPELQYARNLKMWLYKKGFVSPNGSNVSLAAIYSSILNGYKEINLLGVEHSWMKDIKVNDKNEVVLIDRHYYGDTEHVWLDYEGNPIKLIDFIESQLSTFTNHMNLRSFADYLGDVKIINRTKDSYIDAYERGTFEELLTKGN